MKAISLWRPWAEWIVLGYKTIETRRHTRFRGLCGQVVAIHATEKWDEAGYQAAKRWLTPEQIANTEKLRGKLPGRVIGSVFFDRCNWCRIEDEPGALIECTTLRFGHFLKHPHRIEPFEAKGRQGIFTVELPCQTPRTP